MKSTLHIVGTGPGDPELLTLKAARVIAASPVVAWFAKRGRHGHAARIAAAHIAPGTETLRFEYPYTTEIPVDHPDYLAALPAFYDASAITCAERLDTGQDVALLCEGDPFFYGSAMYIFDRLAPRHCISVIPGIPAMAGCWAQAATPITHGDDVLTILPGTLPQTELERRLRDTDAAVIMKVGSNLPKIRAALEASHLLPRATLVDRGTMPGGSVTPMAQAAAAAPYFSLVLVPGRQGLR